MDANQQPNPIEPDALDLPEPEDKAAFDWLRISQQIRQEIMLRLDRGDTRKMKIGELHIFLQCVESSHAADVAALSFPQQLAKARGDDPGFSGAYLDE